jgi:hypothetical protein
MRTLFLLFLLSPILSLGQSFEGTIVFANSFESKSPALKAEQLSAMMGTVQTYYIKGGKYRSDFNGAFIKTQVFDNAENRSYALTGMSDSLYWEDYGKNKEVAIKYEIEKNKETIMGVVCDLLIVHTSTSTSYYYYNKKYPIDPALYTRHAYGNWYYVISKTKSLPLKTVYENEQFIFTSTATKITPMTLDNHLFVIPDKKKVKPATW